MVKLTDEVSAIGPKTGVPFTASETDCGEFGASDVTTKEALRAPATEGFATIWTEQELPALRDWPQVGLVMEKSELFAPEMASELSARE